ncbi:MAG TPA: chromate transporter [Gallicola sp.]|nr:chromate transporter [Gallicola sp.]
MRFKKLRIYFTLFKVTFSISTFTFGGGYIVIPMMRKYFVDDLKLITEEELMDMSAIAHSTPGAIAVNIAVLVGYRIAGIIGAIITGLGTVIPPLLILSIISVFYKSFRDNLIVSAVLKGMEAGVAATIVDILIDMWQGITKEQNILLTLMAPAAFIANYIFNINVLYIIVFCAILCFIQTYIYSKFTKKEGDQIE